jgi:hypothetical protein
MTTGRINQVSIFMKGLLVLFRDEQTVSFLFSEKKRNTRFFHRGFPRSHPSFHEPDYEITLPLSERRASQSQGS